MWGLRRLNQKRLIENTPTSKVRSAAMGLVELAGLARERKPQKSPSPTRRAAGGTAGCRNCAPAQAVNWVTIKQIGSVELFYLDDTTGCVLINPWARSCAL